MMHVERYGDGPRVIVGYHGWAGTHRDFAAVGRLLPSEWTLYAPDLPGYGASPPLEPLTEESLTRTLIEELPAVNTAPAVVAGYCSGAILALLVAEHQPDAVGRLVLVDPFAYLPLYFRIFTLGDVGRRAYHVTFASSLGRRITDAVLSLRKTPDTEFTASFRSVRHSVVLAYLRMFAAVGTPERFRSLAMPVDLCYGEHTFAAVRRSVGMFRHVWPHARVHSIANAGHLIMLKGAKPLARILTNPESPHGTGA